MLAKRECLRDQTGEVGVERAKMRAFMPGPSGGLNAGVMADAPKLKRGAESSEMDS